MSECLSLHHHLKVRAVARADVVLSRDKMDLATDIPPYELLQTVVCEAYGSVYGDRNPVV